MEALSAIEGVINRVNLWVGSFGRDKSGKIKDEVKTEVTVDFEKIVEKKFQERDEISKRESNLIFCVYHHTILSTPFCLLNKWCRQNGMVINTDKTKVMLITSRQKRQSSQHDNLILKMNEVDLKLSSNEKILGINIDENLVWNGHYQYISKKIASSLWLLSQIKSFLKVDDKLLFYNAYIRPYLEYCSAIWGNSTNISIQKMTKLQRRACILILGDEYTHLDEARDKLRILSFDEIVFLNKAKIMYKVANNIAPSYLINLFQMRSASDDTITSLRSVTNKKFLIPKP